LIRVGGFEKGGGALFVIVRDGEMIKDLAQEHLAPITSQTMGQGRVHDSLQPSKTGLADSRNSISQEILETSQGKTSLDPDVSRRKTGLMTQDASKSSRDTHCDGIHRLWTPLDETHGTEIVPAYHPSLPQRRSERSMIDGKVSNGPNHRAPFVLETLLKISDKVVCQKVDDPKGDDAGRWFSHVSFPFSVANRGEHLNSSMQINHQIFLGLLGLLRLCGLCRGISFSKLHEDTSKLLGQTSLCPKTYGRWFVHDLKPVQFFHHLTN
jgi:hypothetical protein